MAQSVFARPFPSSLSKAATTTRTTLPPAPADNGLSLTAKLRLADATADRFALLPEDKQFVFDLNQKQVNAGKGGELVMATRRNFPAPVGTGGAAIPKSIALGVEECLIKCNIPKNK